MKHGLAVLILTACAQIVRFVKTDSLKWRPVTQLLIVPVNDAAIVQRMNNFSIHAMPQMTPSVFFVLSVQIALPFYILTYPIMASTARAMKDTQRKLTRPEDFAPQLHVV